MIGKTISHYRILEKLGSGGMGVVYKAEDTKLGRMVALKVLPPERVADPNRKRRFVQEARAASALNHPNIIVIHDIDEVEGVHYIAMEHVEGKTLDRLIAWHGLRVNEALKYAVQMAAALAKAHSAGIVHRDLKPTNVMVTDDGLVKVLDFGLAKLTEAAPTGDAETAVTLEPTTEEGMIVGTVGYMSPEQAEGKAVDARSDIFSFGSVLYEMLTGQRAFQGETKVSTIAAILREEPKPLSQVVEGLPREVERLVKRCLRKDPAHRFQHMDDLKVALEELKEESDSGELAATPTAETKRFSRTALAAVVVTAIVVAVAGWFWFGRSRSTAPQVPLTAVPLTTYPGIEYQATFSPDGNEVAFSWNGEKQDNYDIYRKLIGPGGPLRLTTDPAEDYSPAWSPDGRFIAFLRRPPSGKIRVYLIPALGGPEQQLAEVAGPGHNDFVRQSYLAWTPDSSRLIVHDRPGPGEPGGLFLLSVDAGEKRRLTSVPAGGRWDVDPALSPDGRTLAFVRHIDLGVGDVYRLSLTENLQPQGEPKRLTFENREVDTPVWTRDGNEILFSSGPWLGERRVRRILVSEAASRTAYPPRSVSFGEDATTLAISPSGWRLAYARLSWISNIYRIELSGTAGRMGTPQRLAASTRLDYLPDFSPDGKRIVFVSTRSGSEEIWVCDADGSNPRQMTSTGGPLTANPRWSPDGRTILFDSRREGTSDLYLMSANGGSPRRLTDHPAYEGQARWSPDGQWIYFMSNRSGRWEVYRMPAGGGDPIQLTKHGGTVAFESADRKWVYYEKGGGLWKVPVGGGEESQVLESLGFELNFVVVEGGVYFLSGQEQENVSLKFFDFATGKTKLLVQTARPSNMGLAISPDKRWILFTQIDHLGSDLMLVDNFR
jgi:serine/threonine protein kinase/WD40 repeat protein